MRWLIVTHWYPPVIEWCYLNHPGVIAASYAEQRKVLDSALFGESSHEVRALRALGHQATDVVVNVRPAQEAWAHEHGITLSSSKRRRWGLRRRFVPWFGFPDPKWMATPLLAQIEEFRPDVVHIESVDLLERDLVLEIKTRARLVIGQIAAPLAPGARLDGYDLMISSLPNFIARFRDQGLDAELLPLAFEPSVLGQIGPLDRTIPVSFVGSISRQHRRRTDLLTAVSTEVPVSIWAPAAGLSLGSPIRRHVRGVAWGLEMYRVMARSRIAINVHIDVAEGHANNLRLFEATGMGALLVTDGKADLGALFEVGREVVAFDDARECVDLIRYYMDHPDKAAEIAAAGQARTLMDHTWSDRMARLVAFAETRIQSGSDAPDSPSGRPEAA